MIPRGYTANFKQYDEMGRLTPIAEYSDSQRPHMEAIVAPWLPVGRFDKGKEEYIVVSAGKPVALDGNGNLVPAGLRKAFNKSGATTILTYVAADVTSYVVDLTTGVAVTAACSYTEEEVSDALKERGLIRADQRAMDFISKPIGVASYNYYKAAGPDHYNPATLYQTNWRPQALVAVTCDYVLQIPVVPTSTATEAMSNDRTAGAATALQDYIDGTSPRVKGWFSATQVSNLVKYGTTVTATTPVVAYMFTNYPLAWITQESPMTASVAGLVKQVDNVSSVTAAGQYCIDYELGLLFVYASDGATIPTPWTTSATITYYHYNAAVSGAGNTYACATGNLEYGDFVTYDESSNYIKAALDIRTAEGYDSSFAPYAADPDYGAGTDADISAQLEAAIANYNGGIIGQVIGVNTFPRDYLDRVHTASQGTAANLRAPGSATGGRTDQLTYTGGAEKIILINVLR